MTSIGDGFVVGNNLVGEQSSRLYGKQKYFLDDITAEGGRQMAASILSDAYRGGFKEEFKSWLESVDEYPKGYDFKFGELSDILKLNWRGLLTTRVVPCWNLEGWFDEDGLLVYNSTTVDEDGSKKTMTKRCLYKDADDFQKKMEQRLLSLTRAIDVYTADGGRSTTEMSIDGGGAGCEHKNFVHSEIGYKDLIDGRMYRVQFDLTHDIGNQILKQETLFLSFRRKQTSGNGNIQGRWWVFNTPGKVSPHQVSKLVDIDLHSSSVIIRGVRFTFQSDKSGSYLTMTYDDCSRNVRQAMEGVPNVKCPQSKKDLFWINVPLATVSEIVPVEKHHPCKVEWNNAFMYMPHNAFTPHKPAPSCVRFTAKSAGPIYFLLAAIPNRPDTWYYLRIAPEGVTAYKGRNKLPQSTNDPAAVGLGSEKLLQTYFVCIESESLEEHREHEEKFTEISYGKLAAGNRQIHFSQNYNVMMSCQWPLLPTAHRSSSNLYLNLIFWREIGNSLAKSK